MEIHIHIIFFLCLFYASISQTPFIVSTQSDTYIIHMDSSSMPKVFTSHHSWYLTTLSYIADDTISASASASTFTKLVYSYTNAINGFSAILSPSELVGIKSSPGYISSTKDTTVKVDTTHSSKFLGLNTNSGAWPKSSYGKDVIIGVVDTGVWPESKSFNDDGMTEVPSRWKGQCQSGTQFNSSMCNKKLIGASYFNKGLLAKFPNLTISMNSARDTEGHGTHTSSTAAGNYVEGASFFGYANGTSTGMAPRARVSMYKALWDEGAYVSDIIAAIDQAIVDGVDVISLSLGLDGVPLYSDPIAIATFAALEKGIFVSTSAGNEGPFLQTLHNGIPWVITVAAGTIDREFTGTISFENGISVSGMTLYPGNFTKQYISIVFMDECKDQMVLNKIHDQIIVCQDKNGTLEDQVFNVQYTQAAAAGIFITNNTDLELTIQSKFPALFVISQEDGDKILDYIKSNATPRAILEFRGTHLGTKPAPKVASYSSRGPSQSCPFVMKPDILAPGALILASWPQLTPVTYLSSGSVYNDFNIISGTSMACPHIAGISALIRSVHPDWIPAAIRSAMMTTADVVDNKNNPIQDIGASNNGQESNPLSMGAGHINVNKALDPGLIYEMVPEDYINLLCAMNYTSNQIKVISRSSSYNCSENPSLDVNYPSFIAFFSSSNGSTGTTIQEFYRTVTNVGDDMSSYIAKVSNINGCQVSVIPDKLVFGGKYEKKSYKLVIKCQGLVKDSVVSGYLSWVGIGGKYVVTSPIVATTLTTGTLSDT